MDILSVSICNDKRSNSYQLDYCCGLSPTTNSTSIHCKSSGELAIKLNQLQQHYPNNIWLTHDLTALIDLTSEIGFQLADIQLIDLTTEAKMVMLTHPKYKSVEQSIESAYEVFNVKLETSHSQRQTNLLERILHLLNPQQDIEVIHLFTQQMVNRGDYIKAHVQLAKQGAGFPIDEDKLHEWFDNKVATINRIQQQVNQHYGELYLTSPDNPIGQLSHERLALLAKVNGIQWQKWGTSNYLKLDKGYLKELANQQPELTLLYQSFTCINTINSTDLRQLNNKGYIKPSLHLMSQKTGRNSPKPSEGYLLNAGVWVRSLIKPKPDHCIIAIDWCQQEIGIAGVLSNDQQFMDIYNTPDGDVYIALAKQAGFAPSNATKHTHPEIRQVFKTMQIGLGYGKTVWSLAKDINAISTNLTLAQAYSKAQQIYNWHKQTFTTYWQWINNTIHQAREQGYMQSLDGWIYFVDDKVRDTQLINFPMQANGAALIRLAIKHLVKCSDIDFICTQHDAIYVNSPINDKERVMQQVQSCMDKACGELFGGRLLLRTEMECSD